VLRFSISKNTIVFLFFILIFTVFYSLNFKIFLLWNQIIESYAVPSISAIKSHTVRIMLINGLIYIVQFFFDTDRIVAFNISSHIILFLSTIIFSKVLYKNLTKDILIIIFLSLSVILVSFFQNGRGIFGCFSIILLYYTLFIKNTKLKWFFVFVAILFSNVSSGIFSVLLISIILGSLNKTLTFIKKKHLIILILLLTPLLIIYANKNLEYFDYDFFKLLSHGLGSIFQTDLITLIAISLILIVFFFVSFFYIFIVNTKVLYSINLPFISSSIIGIFFGFSSFTCFIYIYLLILFIKLKKKILSSSINNRVKCDN
jgi:hypothetical protein